jgi:hypothetical protein
MLLIMLLSSSERELDGLMGELGGSWELAMRA